MTLAPGARLGPYEVQSPLDVADDVVGVGRVEDVHRHVAEKLSIRALCHQPLGMNSVSPGSISTMWGVAFANSGKASPSTRSGSSMLDMVKNGSGLG